MERFKALRLVYQHQSPAPQSSLVRRGYGEAEASSHGSVHCIASSLQDLGSDLRAVRMVGDNVPHGDRVAVDLIG